MSAQQDGGPAFPHQIEIVCNDPRISRQVTDGGMALRDWFAGMALQGLMVKNGTDTPQSTLASWSYSSADAMLAAREIKGEVAP